MGFKDLVLNSVSSAMKTVGDLALSSTFVKHTGGSYDPVTGNTTETTTPYEKITVVFAKFTAEEKDTDVIILTDSKALIAAKDLPVEPEKDDEITNAKGSWDVIKIMGVPGDSLWILHVRKIR